MIDFTVGLFAILAFVSMPGLSLLKKGFSLERLGTAFAVSIGINSFMIMIAAMNGFYTRFWFWTWIVLLFLISGWIILRFRPRFEFDGLKASKWIWILFPFFLLFGYKAWFLPYYTWDAVASWNRWARNFALDPDYFRDSDFFYTQFMSWGMSVPYIGSGNPTLEYISHGYAFFLTIVLFAGISRLSRSLNGNPVLSFSILFWTFPFSAYAATGYADIGTSAFTAFSLALILESFDRKECQYISFYLPNIDFPKAFLAGITAGIAFHFKQSSTPVLFVFCGFLLLFSFRGSLKEKLKYGLVFGTGFAIPVLPWILSKSTTLSGPHFLYLVSGIHSDPSFTGIMTSGLQVLVRQISILNFDSAGWLTLIVAAIAFLFAFQQGDRHKVLILAVTVSGLVWMGTASYDARALMPVIVPGAVLCASGFQSIFRNAGKAKTLIVPLISLFSLFTFLFSQFFPTLRVVENRIWDWKQGELWIRIPAQADRIEQLRILQPTLAELEEWKKENIHIDGLVWSDHMLFPSVDPFLVDGGARWLEEIEGNGEIRWKKGDFLIVSRTQSEARKLPHPLTDGRLHLVQPLWKDWIQRALETGMIRLDAEYKNLTVYQFN